MGKVVLVGAGPGDPTLITIKGLQYLKKADVVVYDRLVNKKLLRHCKKNVILFDASKIPGSFSISQEKINKVLWEFARRYRLVVRLKGGDPIIFGRSAEEVEYLTSRKIQVEIVPGITAASSAACSTKIPLTRRNVSSVLILATGHPADESTKPLDFSKIPPIGTLAIYMGIERCAEIVQQLLKAGWHKDTPAAIVKNASLPDEITIITNLKKLPEEIMTKKISPPAIIFVGDVVSL